MHKVMQNKLTKSLIILPIFGIIVLSFLYINIYVEGALMNSSAINDTDSYNFNLTDTTNLSISLPAPESLTLTPSAEGVFGSKSIAVGVSTNSPYGYTLTMSAASSSLSRSAAVGGIIPTIPTLESAVSEADFPSNYWGFKRTSTAVADTNYQPMLANHSVLVNNTSANADSSSSTITFGVKLSNETPSGDYSINIDFLAVTNVAPNLYYMQDATPSSLAAAMPNVHDTTVLYDRRDGQEYTIAKLKDGKYWMTKNLNLAGGTVLTSEDTDMASDWVLPTANGFLSGNKLPESSTTGFSDSSQAYIYNSGNNTDDCTNGCYSYYSWNAATLGSGADIIEGRDTDALYSICPKGWKLPTSRSALELAKTSSDFYQLAIHYGLNPADVNENPENAPTFCSLAGDGGNYCGNKTIPNFLRAGYYANSVLYNGGGAGHYWSSSARSNTIVYSLTFNTGLLFTSADNNSGLGFAVRCLFDDTMQSFSSDYANAMAMEETITLRDARDNQEYTVAKLKDGKVWMTKNLNLAGGSTLTPADSDVAENYTLPASSTTGFDNNGANYAYVYNTGNITDDCSDGCYSYYSFNTATAMSGINITDILNTSYSICPKGWRLPTGNGILGDFYSMAKQYGLNSDNANDDPNNDFCNLAGDCSANIPHFLRNGAMSNGNLGMELAEGWYWSATARFADWGEALSFMNTNVYSQLETSNDHWAGLSAASFAPSSQ